MRRIDFKDFQDIVKREIRDYLPDDFRDAEVELKRMEKLGSSYNALAVTKDGDGAYPVVNLDQFYKDYLHGSTLTECMLSMAETIQEGHKEFDVTWLNDYEKVKEHLFIRVSNAEKNSELLEKVPHRTVDDLAITCHMEVSLEKGTLASAIITNKIMEMYGVTKEQLLNDSIENSVKLMPVTIRNLGEVIGEYVDETSVQRRSQAYVISNKTSLNGAASIFYPEVLDDLSRKVGGDLLIAPSSIHEVIALPATDETDLSSLEETVRFINRTQVSEGEQLGDHLYKYDARTHSLESVWSDSLSNTYSNQAFVM